MAMSYDETMRYGAEQYADVCESLRSHGLRAEFTQTGGMCAAIMVQLEAGAYLLITDRDDTLAWERENHDGWYVGLYSDIDAPGSEPVRWSVCDRSDTAALLDLIDSALAPPGTDSGEQV